MPDVIFAFDKQTARSFDADGRMRVKNCVLSTAEINPYRGEEIPGWQKIGLDANKVYELYRDPEEMKKAAASAEGVPLMVKHIPQTADSPRKEYIGGSIHNVTFDGKHLRGDLLVWDGYAIDLIESDTLSDLSCGYRYDPVMQSGEADGSKYDGVMRNLQFNHVALVDDGRASGAHVADHAFRNPQSPDPAMQGDSTMPFPEKEEGAAAPQAGAGGAANPAPGGAAPGSPEGEQNEQMNMAAIGQALKHIAGLLENIHGKLGNGGMDTAAMDAEAGSGETPPGEPTPEAEDGELEPAVKGGGAMDEDEGGGEMPKQAPQEGTTARGGATPTGAMDAKTVKALVSAAVMNERAAARAAEQARREVAGVLGDAYGLDSAGDIYRAALEQIGVDVKAVPKGAEMACWQASRAAVSVAAGARRPADAMAMDSNGAAAAASTQSKLAALAGRISVKG